ncbi:Tm-1-like ATP-binding domain-containing protein [Aliifodinibius sp. S!AR15-10]|uniref:Tm-1-like ATP-binding domain-containing protein n=1 Tax=Aliifodinibius sp. S!AR15-10 TaxID=2950437 RepID=UPI002867306B|nr:Tm-1-like ATP-binding domain-containing protein [Aliifodinibius sp. S!AR15-10]MDR8393615.1 Tm-1-like ATP-binding domain-containing protein [Aliifodinibius sp. S!AR15-10]
MTKKVVVPGAFDSKGEEYNYLINRIKEQGYGVVTVNTGVLGSTDLFDVDIPAEQVAEAGGTDLSTLREERDRGKAIGVMSDGLATVLEELFEKHNIDGIIGMGGSAGTNVVTSGMRALPYGVPKICISTVASGDVAPYVGVSDIIMIPSLIDIAGINSLSTAIFSRAVGALSGMIETRTGDRAVESGPVIGASMFGNTTPCIDACRKALSREGFDVLVFHATGTGGKTMEKLINEGRVQGALDITTTEWADTICGGVFDAGPERLDGPGKAGIPHLIAPGCIDMCNFGNPSTIPSHYEGRLFYEWNPQVTLMRTTAEENRKMGEVFAEKANQANGEIAFIIPLQGYSMLDSVNKSEPQLFWDPEADKAFVEGLKSTLNTGIEVVEVNANINDEKFSDKAVEMLLEMM